jgi:uncharacterized membrane protein
LVRKHRDLLTISLLTVTGAVLGIAGIHLGAWLSIFGILLVLVLPGYVFSTVLLPQLPFGERMLVSLGLSVIITGLSGLILSLTPWGLQASTWGVWLALITLAGIVILRRRRGSTGEGSWINWPKVHWLQIVLYGSAVLFVLLAFGFSRLSSKGLDSPLTLLWGNLDPTNGKVLNIGIQNEEDKSMTYNLVVELNGVRVREWTGIRLASMRTFSEQYIFEQAPQQPISILLYREDAPREIYRQVRLVLPTSPEQLSRK